MSARMLAQDPNELFDVVLADGTPTGRTKPRAAVHRDGDWHRSVHVWVAGLDNGAPFLLFQRRGLDKDTWPGRLDATVGGHYRAGEGLDDALREVEEEIGVPVSRSDLLPLGTRVCVNDGELGILDHEIQEVFLLRDDRPLSAYRPNVAELAALVSAPLAALFEFLSGNSLSAPARSLSARDLIIRDASLVMADLIPTIDRYFYRVAIAAGLILRGERHAAV